MITVNDLPGKPGFDSSAPVNSELYNAFINLGKEIFRQDNGIEVLDPTFTESILSQWETILSLSIIGSYEDRLDAIIAEFCIQGLNERQAFRDLSKVYSLESVVSDVDTTCSLFPLDFPAKFSESQIDCFTFTIFYTPEFQIKFFEYNSVVLGRVFLVSLGDLLTSVYDRLDSTFSKIIYVNLDPEPLPEPDVIPLEDRNCHLFENHTQQEHAQSLADYLPGGPLFEAKNDINSNLRNLLLGFGAELLRVEKGLNDISCEYDLNRTTLLLEEWERALGIPDGCFPGTGSIAIRRQHVLIKLSSLGISTQKGFIDLAALFGYKALIPSGATYAVFPLSFPGFFFSGPTDPRFTMLVFLDAVDTPETFPFTSTKFPVPFFSNTSTIIECLMRKLKPANVNIIFRYQPLP